MKTTTPTYSVAGSAAAAARSSSGQAPWRALPASVLAMLLVLMLAAVGGGCQPRSSAPPSVAPAGPWPGPAPAAPTALYLPPAHTDAGVLVRMLLAECRGPAYPDYDEQDAYWTMQAMKAVVHNRLFGGAAEFGAPGARSYADVICAPGQWAGFGRGPRGEYLIEPQILARVDAILLRANSGQPGRYHRFVHHALAITYGPVVDPFAQLHQFQGLAVRPGAYGWRRQGSSAPGGNFVAIPLEHGGVRGGNQFYAVPLR